MALHRQSGVETWDNEGGVPLAAVAASRSGTRAVAPDRRAPRDTVAGCRDSAASDLAQAGRMDTANGRLRFEHSAACWTARGDLLQRLDDGRRTRAPA